MNISSQLLWQHTAKGNDFLFNVVTDNESWFHHLNPEMKWQNMKWHHKTSPKKRKALESWEMHIGWFYAERGNHQCSSLHSDAEETATFTSWKVSNDFLQHNRACPHTAHLTPEISAYNGWEVLPYPPYILLDLTSSEYTWQTSTTRIMMQSTKPWVAGCKMLKQISTIAGSLS
jgi:hypothetical protein